MCKICSRCKGVMNYDPYFNAEVCAKCGSMEKIESLEWIKYTEQSTQNFNILKQIVGTNIARL